MAGLAQRPRGTAHPKASRSAATDSPAGLPALARTEGLYTGDLLKAGRYEH